MTPRPSIAVAASGGRDSMALLHCLARAGKDAGLQVLALHVHHGLMPQADDWAVFVQRTCARWSARGLPLSFHLTRLTGRPARGQSVEAWARAGRYAALGNMAQALGCGVVALAHHRGDQAETFLLQALRGAGAAGLSAMPARIERAGVTWVRPWLEQPREAIEAYVRTHRIRFVDDASNADPRFARSRLRHQVMPALRAVFPDAERCLAEAARHAARARTILDEVAAADLAAVRDGPALSIDAWVALSPARRRECLRAWLAGIGGAGVVESLLDRLMQELPHRAPARWPIADGELRRYRGRLTAHALAAGRAPRTDATPRPPAEDAWPRAANADRTGLHRVAGCAGGLRVSRSTGGHGIALALLRDAQWRPRHGGERFQRAPGTPARSLKKQFQSAAVPAWSRDAPLLVAADGTLLFVPGLGMDARAVACPGRPRVRLEWVAQP